ncbi:MAG: spore cortex biosynthesis protein YabQ [Clostridium sp.]|nr:spore cortex biosynthesis protein YabQ [Clostridium sp.]
MPLALDIQFDMVTYSILAGVITGILFDLYNIIRGIKVPKIIRAVEDILFWILSAFIVFTFLLYINYAFLGPYVYIFMIITLVIYLKVISPIVIRVEKIVIKKCANLIRILFKNIMYPIRIIFHNVYGKK